MGEREEFGAAVIGGGLMGLSCAIHLARAGESVALLEAGRVGSGQSGASGGQALAGFEVGADDLEERFGREGAQKLFGFTLASREALRGELKRSGAGIAGERGGVALALSGEHERRLRQGAEGIRRLGGMAEELRGEALAARVRSARARMGILDRDAFQIDPEAAIAALGEEARSLGADLREGWRAKRIGQGWVEREGGERIRAGWVIVAAGLGAEALLEPPGLRRAFPVLTSIGRIEGFGREVADGVCAYDAREAMAYFRKAGGDFRFGGCDSQFRRPEGRARAALERELREFFPGFRGRVAEVRQAAFDATANRLPHVEIRGRILSARGLNGHGVSLAFGLGREMALFALGRGDLGFLAERLSAPRLPALGPLFPLAAQAYLAWAKARDARSVSR